MFQERLFKIVSSRKNPNMLNLKPQIHVLRNWNCCKCLFLLSKLLKCIMKIQCGLIFRQSTNGSIDGLGATPPVDQHVRGKHRERNDQSKTCTRTQLFFLIPPPFLHLRGLTLQLLCPIHLGLFSHFTGYILRRLTQFITTIILDSSPFPMNVLTSS